MAKRPALSKAELEIAKTVWNLGEAGVRQVFEAFSTQRDIDFTTVQTYLRRLESKGYLRSERRGRGLVYRPRVRADDVIRETIDDFVHRLFDGRTAPLLQYLIRDQSVGEEEIRQLRAMIDQWEQKHESAG
jgi:BlaI family transcriptional regulator, penicillinase repressor